MVCNLNLLRCVNAEIIYVPHEFKELENSIQVVDTFQLSPYLRVGGNLIHVWFVVPHEESADWCE